MPGWDLFQQQVGDSDLSRRLFTEMMRAESSLLTAFDQGDADLPKQMLGRLLNLSQNNSLARNGSAPQLSRASLATMLFTVAQFEAPPDSMQAQQLNGQLTARLFSLLISTQTMQIFLQESYSPLIKRLLVRWVDTLGKRTDGSHAYFGMQLALKYELKESGVRIARDVLLQKSSSYSSSKPYAAILIARFGGLEDARYLEPHLNDTQVFHTWSNAQLKKEPIRIQVRDVMLAMLIRLHGQKPEDFGYKLLEPFPETLYRIWTFGFLEDEERDAAFEKGRELVSSAAAPPAADAQGQDALQARTDEANGG